MTVSICLQLASTVVGVKLGQQVINHSEIVVFVSPQKVIIIIDAIYLQSFQLVQLHLFSALLSPMASAGDFHHVHNQDDFVLARPQIEAARMEARV